MSFMVRRPPLARGAGVGQQRHLTAVLHGRGDVALVLGAVAGDPAGPDLAAVGDELPQQAGVLVVHVGDLLLAELTDLLLGLTGRWLGHRGAPDFGCPAVWLLPGWSTGECGSVRGGAQNGGSSEVPGAFQPPPPPPPPAGAGLAEAHGSLS